MGTVHAKVIFLNALFVYLHTFLYTGYVDFFLILILKVISIVVDFDSFLFGSYVRISCPWSYANVNAIEYHLLMVKETMVSLKMFC